MSSMYIRCKRTIQTVFIYVENNDSIAEVKKKLSAMVKTPPENMKLLSEAEIDLPEDKTISDLKIESDAVVYWVQKKEGTNDWEEVNLQKIELPKAEDKGDQK